MNRKAKARAVLGRARDLVQRGWCQHAWARDVDGEWTADDDENAASWCAMGATVRAEHDLGLEPNSVWIDAVDVLERTLGTCCVDDYNDEPLRTKEDILRLFDEALQRK